MRRHCEAALRTKGRPLCAANAGGPHGAIIHSERSCGPLQIDGPRLVLFGHVTNTFANQLSAMQRQVER